MMMRSGRSVARWTVGIAVAGALAGCTSQAPPQPAPALQKQVPQYQETAMPTVPPSTPKPPESPTPIPTYVDAGAVEPKIPIGPMITYFGVARADGMVVPPLSTDPDGVAVYKSIAGSGFILVIEAAPGKSGIDPGRQIFNHDPANPAQRPDFELITNRDLGDGSKAVCDRRKPVIGGVPAVNPPNFKPTQAVSDAINDLGCRFETFIESESSCTLDKYGNFSFANAKTTTQFCAIFAKSFSLPVGTTELHVRVRDTAGNPGPVKKLRIIRPADSAKPPKSAPKAAPPKQ